MLQKYLKSKKKYCIAKGGSKIETFSPTSKDNYIPNNILSLIGVQFNNVIDRFKYIKSNITTEEQKKNSVLEMYDTLYTQDVLNGDEWRYFLNLERYLIKIRNRETKKNIFLNLNPNPGSWSQDQYYNIENKLIDGEKIELSSLFTNDLEKMVNGFLNLTSETVDKNLYNQLDNFNKFIQKNDKYTQNIKDHIRSIFDNLITNYQKFDNIYYNKQKLLEKLIKSSLPSTEYDKLPTLYKNNTYYKKCEKKFFHETGCRDDYYKRLLEITI